MSEPVKTVLKCEFTAEQIRTALIDAVRDEEPLHIQESLAALLALHYRAGCSGTGDLLIADIQEAERLQHCLAVRSSVHIAAEVARLSQQVGRLRMVLGVALEDMLDMRSYVPEFFAEKWQHDLGIAKVRAALTETGPDPVAALAEPDPVWPPRSESSRPDGAA